MSETTIEWTRNADGSEGKTWNPMRGCSLASDECSHCYAQSIARRFSGPGKPFEGLINGHGKWNGVMQQAPTHTLYAPLTWRKPTRVFVNSMTDLFHENAPFEWIDRTFAVMALCPRHTFIILTKRAGRMREYLSQNIVGPRVRGVAWEMLGHLGKYRHDDVIGRPWPLPNVILGVSVGRRAFLSRIDDLRETLAVVRMVSFEPLLEDLGPVELGGIGWAVVGGESGSEARRFDVAWARDIVQQCKDTGVAAFVKQLGARPTWNGCAGADEHWPPNTERVDNGNGYWEIRLRDRKGGDWEEWPADLRVREFPQRERE